MAPLKTWAPYERLNANDLNGAFAEVAAGKMPGLICTPGGVTSIGAGATVEVSPGDPGAGNNEGGYWNSSSKRAVVPVGLHGLHVVTVHITCDPAAADNSKGRLLLIGISPPNAGQSFTRYAPGAGSCFATLTVINFLPAGAVVYPQVHLLAAGNVYCVGFTVIRLASHGTFAGSLEADAKPAPEPEVEPT